MATKQINQRKSSLTAYYQNIRSINNKTLDIMSASVIDNYDILFFTETWLKQEISNEELKLFNYKIYRCDRSGETSLCTRGGGVMIAINGHPSYQLNVINNSIEQVFAMITISNYKILVGCVYFPPDSQVQAYEEFCSSTIC